MNNNALPERVFGLPPERGRWGFLLLGLLVNLCLGAVYAYSVFKEPLRETLGLTATQGNLPFMAFIAVFSVGTAFSGRFLDRYGPRAVMMSGSVLVGIGWMLARFSGGLGGLLLTYSLLGGIGVGIVYGGPVAVAARWFPDKKGLAVGLALAGFGMSALVTAPIARHLIAMPSVGVLNTFGLMGAAFLLLCVILSAPMRFPLPGWNPAGWTPPATGPLAVHRAFTRRDMLATRAFWALAGCYTLGTTAGLMAIGISAPAGRELIGLDPAAAALLVSVFAVLAEMKKIWVCSRSCRVYPQTRKEKVMKTRISAGVIKIFLLIIMLQCLCAHAQAKDADRSAEYMAEIASMEHFNEVQRASDMPGMSVPTYAEWLKTKMAEESFAVTSNTTAEDEPNKQDRMRQWLNYGINTPDDEPSSKQEQSLARRERLWAMSAQLIKSHEAEMEVARARIKRAGFAEYGKTEDGIVIGLVGLQDGLPRYNITYNASAADTISVDELWPGGISGLAITGSNTVMGIWDGGDVLTNHLEFIAGAATRIVDMDGVSPLPIDWHPTAVAGTMSAGGNGYSSAKGMAYNSTVWAYDWYNDLLSEMNSAYANNVRLSNHSYGNQAGWGFIQLSDGSITNCWWGDLSISGNESFLFGRYDSYCTNMDAISYGNPLSLTIWAAGNERTHSAPPAGTQYRTFTNGVEIWSTDSRPHDYAKNGYDTITDRGLAKNVLTVGAIHKIIGGYSGIGSVNIAAFSSWGPTDDGRIKPDVVAAGVDVFTPIRHPSYPSNPYYYITTSGTSFSAPSVAGAVGLLVDLRTRLAPQHPYLASTLKGLLIHTADEAETIGPDYKTGWGLVNAYTAANLVQSDSDDGGKQYIKEVTLLDGDYIEFAVTATGGTPLKTTICWTDPAGAAQPLQLNPTNLVLVNDLDLRIISPNGSTNYPWILNPANPSNSATKGDNYRDNVEQVVITNAVADEQYIVRITHKGILVDDTGQPSFQDVSIVTTGIEPETRAYLAIAESSFTSDSEIVMWPSVVGQNYRVQSTVNLLDQDWTNVSAEISASKTNTTWESELPPPGIHQFYRLIKTN